MIVSLVTTKDRSHALARTLPQVAALGWPVLVIDDGSGDEHVDANMRITRESGALYMRTAENRGLAAAMNIGLAYWLADSRVTAVGYFQDDVDVLTEPATQRIAAWLDIATDRPLMTLHDAAEHDVVGIGTVGTFHVKLKHNCRATHLMATRDYWMAVTPIPTRRLGAPLPLERLPPDVQQRHRQNGETRGEGSEVDHWITHRSPNSIVARGGYVLCMPGALRTYLWDSADSCWGNRQRAGEDAPLVGA